MTDLDQFSSSAHKHTSKHKEDVIFLIKDMFALWMTEFSKTLGTIFSSPASGKGQVSLELDKREDDLIRQRQL
jgi:hypothetical protein